MAHRECANLCQSVTNPDPLILYLDRNPFKIRLLRFGLNLAC